MEKKTDENLTEEQFAFRKNRGAHQAILCLQNILQKYFRVNIKIYFAFVDLLKAFDNVNWYEMMKILKMIKIDYRDRIIIRKLYKQETTSIKIK